MATVSPGVILCIMIAKFYAGESQGYSARFASLPLLAESEPNKESRTVGGEEPFFCALLLLASQFKLPGETTKSANTAELVFLFSWAGVICSVPTKHFQTFCFNSPLMESHKVLGASWFS